MSKIRSSYAQQRKIEELILANSSPHPDDPQGGNRRIWHDGWNRERCAKEVYAHLNENHTRYVIDQLGLTLENKPASPTTIADLSKALSILQDAVSEINNSITSIRNHLDELQQFRENLEGSPSNVTSIRKG